ncbi:hypothetical protein OG333_33390 [Streptomyces anulatus]|nr:hypothetical protein OG333_33390 [Streptomyces anulatus]
MDDIVPLAPGGLVVRGPGSRHGGRGEERDTVEHRGAPFGQPVEDI